MLWALAALLLAAAGGWLLQARRSPDVLLISIDTLRADRLGCYGHAEAQTPALDALAARGLRFTQATTTTPLTLPAHASLLTGTFPSRHGVRDNGGFYLGDEPRSLASVLKAHGYRTGGFVSAFVLDSRWGVQQGFERYFDDFDLSKYEGRGLDAVQRRGDETVAKMLEWLGQESGRPLFAWVHLYDPHTPYDAPEPYRSRFPKTLEGAYDAEVAWSDALVQRLLDGLAARGRLKRTVLAVVGDHGEALGEHGEATHGFFLYDATLQIPLIFAGPGVPALRVDEQVRIVDVMPTLLELAGVPLPAGVQGVSLMPLAHGKSLGLTALAETWYPRYHYGWSELTALRDRQYKFVQAPRPELYGLTGDPGETSDLAGREPARVAALQRALQEKLAGLGGAPPARAPEPVDPEAEERLAALGYAGGVASERALEERPRADPKDRIELYNLLREATQSSLEGRLDEAVAQLGEALSRDPEIVEAYTLLGNVQMKAGRPGEAVAAYRHALELDSKHQGAAFSLALAYKQMGRAADAEAGFERARQLDPRGSKALWQLADLWMQQGRFDRAEGVLQEALARKVDRPAFLLKLGECYIDMKRYDEAGRLLGEALSIRPALAGAHYDLALVHEARGESGRALQEYEAELSRDPKAHRASFNRAKLLLQARRLGEAIVGFRASVDANPEFGIGYLYLAKALLDAGDLRGAQQAARQGLGLKLDAKVAPLGHYVLADVYARQGRDRDAAREVAAARRLEAGG